MMEFSGDCGVMASVDVVGRRELWEIIIIIFISCEINEVMFFSDMLLSVAKLYVYTPGKRGGCIAIIVIAFEYA
jgi:hypothetical protein